MISRLLSIIMETCSARLWFVLAWDEPAGERSPRPLGGRCNPIPLFFAGAQGRGPARFTTLGGC
jgi:hypothetical protein